MLNSHAGSVRRGVPVRFLVPVQGVMQEARGVVLRVEKVAEDRVRLVIQDERRLGGRAYVNELGRRQLVRIDMRELLDRYPTPEQQEQVRRLTQGWGRELLEAPVGTVFSSVLG
jgi:hypothetical protein